MNNTARIFFENTDGSMEDGVSDEDLPYDVSAPVVEIEDTQFGVFYLDAMEHPDRYDGKTIHVKGRAFRMNGMPKKCFVFGRHAMTCCVNDIGGIGYLCKVQGELSEEGRVDHADREGRGGVQSAAQPRRDHSDCADDQSGEAAGRGNRNVQ